MQKVTVKTQKQYDNLPESFATPTVIELDNNGANWLYIYTCPQNASLRAINDSRVRIYNNVNLKALGRSVICAYNNSSVLAFDACRLHMRHFSSVKACGFNYIYARGQATVEALLVSFVIKVSKSVNLKYISEASLVTSEVITPDEAKAKLAALKTTANLEHQKTLELLYKN